MALDRLLPLLARVLVLAQGGSESVLVRVRLAHRILARFSRCASAVDFAGHRPSARGQLEWIVASPEALAESGSKGGLEVLIERLAERAGRANTGRQRRP